MRAISQSSSVSMSMFDQATGPIAESCTVTFSASTTATPWRPFRSSVALAITTSRALDASLPHAGEEAPCHRYTPSPQVSRAWTLESVMPWTPSTDEAVLPLDRRVVCPGRIAAADGDVSHGEVAAADEAPVGAMAAARRERPELRPLAVDDEPGAPVQRDGAVLAVAAPAPELDRAVVGHGGEPGGDLGVHGHRAVVLDLGGDLVDGAALRGRRSRDLADGHGEQKTSREEGSDPGHAAEGRAQKRECVAGLLASGPAEANGAARFLA